MHNFRKLAVWQKSKDLGNEIFQLCARVRRGSDKIVAAQLTKSALRISAAIAEGCGKNTRAESIRYLTIALGSSNETEHHLIVARDNRILPPFECMDLLHRTAQISRMIEKLIRNFPPD